MPLKPRSGALTKECILNFGPYSGGKSNGWAQTRQMYETTDTPGKFYIISTETEMAERTAEGYMDGTAGNNFFTNAEIQTPTDYESLMRISEKYREAGTEQDWIITDSIGKALTWSRDVWFTEHFDMTWKQFQTAGRKISEVKPENWMQMASLYKDWFIPNIIGFPGHRYSCAQAETVATSGAWADSPAIQKMFGRIGAKPVGDKELAYAHHTVLFSTMRSHGEWITTTVDDPGRPYLVDEPVVSFPYTYLMQVAGWQVT